MILNHAIKLIWKLIWLPLIKRRIMLFRSFNLSIHFIKLITIVLYVCFEFVEVKALSFNLRFDLVDLTLYSLYWPVSVVVHAVRLIENLPIFHLFLNWPRFLRVFDALYQKSLNLFPALVPKYTHSKLQTGQLLLVPSSFPLIWVLW